MKVIFLNIWGGKLFQPLTQFIEKQVPTTDFFCFQELFNSDKRVNIDFLNVDAISDILNCLKQVLPGYNAFYAPANLVEADNTKVSEGLGIFAKKSINIDSEGDIVVHANDGDKRPLQKIKNLQYIRFSKDGKIFTLCNIHGITFPGDKLDTENRLSQSQKIIEFLSKENGEKILGGDLNLMPQTKSIEIIESGGMKNLIKEFNIASTRSDVSYAMYPLEKEPQKFADFAFVSQGISVKSFKVPRLDISDHLPLILNFD